MGFLMLLWLMMMPDPFFHASSPNIKLGCLCQTSVDNNKKSGITIFCLLQCPLVFNLLPSGCLLTVLLTLICPDAKASFEFYIAVALLMQPKDKNCCSELIHVNLGCCAPNFFFFFFYNSLIIWVLKLNEWLCFPHSHQGTLAVHFFLWTPIFLVCL